MTDCRLKTKKKNYMESEILSINLAILMSRFDSPPQSCVDSVIWTCEDIYTLVSITRQCDQHIQNIFLKTTFKSLINPIKLHSLSFQKTFHSFKLWYSSKFCIIRTVVTLTGRCRCLPASPGFAFIHSSD